MGIDLRLLLVEDNEDDAFLLTHSLRQSGFGLTWERVQTPVEFEAALNAQTWDVIICDYNLPRFSAPAALEMMHASGLDLPFIILSGVINEKTAVQIMAAGAKDVLFKNNLARLPTVLTREINSARARAELKRIEAAMRESEGLYRGLVENGPDAILVQINGKFAYLNATALALFGAASPQDLVGQDVLARFHPKYHQEILERMATIRDARVKVLLAEQVCLRLDGKEVPVEVAAAPIHYEGQDGSLVFIRDISLRKAHEAEMDRINRLYVVQSEINRAALHACASSGSDTNFLAEVCRLFSSQEGMQMAVVVQLATPLSEKQTRTPASPAGQGSAQYGLRVVAASGAVAPDLVGLDIKAFPTWIVRKARVVLNRPEGLLAGYHNQKLLQNTSGKPWRDWLESSAWQATAIFPIWVKNNLWGMLGIFATDEGLFSDRDMSLLEACVDDVAYGITAVGD